jgi:hypothetical protein
MCFYSTRILKIPFISTGWVMKYKYMYIKFTMMMEKRYVFLTHPWFRVEALMKMAD